jgi:hypothetical protein
LGFTKSLAQHSANLGGDIGDVGDVDGGWLNILDFGAVPVTVWLTLLFLFVGTLGITLNSWFLPAPPTGVLYNAVWTANLGASSLVSYWIVRKASKPLSFLFRDYGVAEQASALFGFLTKSLPLQAVILNACHSIEQAEAISHHIPYVVGTTVAIADQHAIAFSIGFYMQLSMQKDIALAYEAGKTRAILEGAQSDNFELLIRA